MTTDVVVVGGGVAGVSAARAAARAGAHVTLLEASKTLGVSKPLLPMLVAGKVGQRELENPEAGELPGLGVALRTGQAVTSVDHAKRRVLFAGGGPGLEYDSLVLCTGAVAQPPGLKGEAKRNVFVLGGAADYLRLSESIDELDSFAVTGPVPLGLRIAQAISSRGKRVALYCGRGGLARQFSPRAAEMIRAAAQGVELLDSGVDSVLGIEKVEAVTSEGSVRGCEAVVVAPLSAPSYPRAEVEKGRDGGILVDDSMTTSLRGVYAAGDSVEVRFKSGSLATRLFSASRVGGSVAGTNAAGGSARASLSWSFEANFFGVEYSSAGLAQRAASELGLESAEETCSYSNDGNETEVTLVYDRKTHQVYGVRSIGWRASALSGASSLIVSMGLTVEQLADTEFARSPHPGWHVSPIALTAGKIRGQVRP